MTGNKFAGKTCAYGCVRPSTTADRVLAKGWFLEAQRDGLPQAPACAECNGAKAKLESELMWCCPSAADTPTRGTTSLALAATAGHSSWPRAVPTAQPESTSYPPLGHYT